MKINPTTENTQIEIAQRRELALRATDLLAEVTGIETSVPRLLETAGNKTIGHGERITAKRSLRFLEAVSRPNSEIVKRLGEDLYPVAEAFIKFGASEKRYVELMDAEKITAQQATGVYALRENIRDITDDNVGLDQVMQAAKDLGFSAHDIHTDTEEILISMNEAGYLVEGPITINNVVRTQFRPDVGQRHMAQEWSESGIFAEMAEIDDSLPVEERAEWEQ